MLTQDQQKLISMSRALWPTPSGKMSNGTHEASFGSTQKQAIAMLTESGKYRYFPSSGILRRTY